MAATKTKQKVTGWKSETDNNQTVYQLYNITKFWK